MSRRHALAERLQLYDELREIMKAMRNIAVMEIHRLQRILEAQDITREAIEQAATAFFAGNPHLLPRRTTGAGLLVAIGSERGFCGDFNTTILQRLRAELAAAAQPPAVVLVGARLIQAAQDIPGVALRLAGPAMQEEVRPALASLFSAMAEHAHLQRAFTLQGLGIIHHSPPNHGVANHGVANHGAANHGAASRNAVDRGVASHDVATHGAAATCYRPAERMRELRDRVGAPPELLLPPAQCLQGILEQYLSASMHSVFFGSLTAENHVRLAHMETAVHRLDERIALGRQRQNVLRQEEITEEVEEIMLSTEALRRPGGEL